MQRFKIKVPKADHAERLDLAILNANTGLSRRKIRQIIDSGAVFLNQRRIRIASRKVTSGDLIEFQYNPETLKKLKVQNFEFTADDVIFDEFGVVAINKPPGLPSQATRDQSVQHVVPVLQKFYGISDNRKPHFYLAHRLDKETSGILLLARDKTGMEFLTDQFRNRTIQKYYLAICYGIPSWDEKNHRSYLSSIDKKTGKVAEVRSGGKSSETAFKLLSKDKGNAISLILCAPKTGRSHQIRVHLESLGHPIVGDKKYGNSRFLKDELARYASEHHLLHAYELIFNILDAGEEKTKQIKADVPNNFKSFFRETNLMQPK